MRTAIATLVVALGTLSLTASAADVDFEIGPKLCEEPAVVEENFALFSYNSPLYDGLWPMTREAFRRSDWNTREVFTFNIAFNR